MFEMLINPKKAERKPWELFFVGIFYASVAVLFVDWVFASDPVLSQASGILVVTFTVMFSLPFVFYTIKHEENKIESEEGGFSLLKEHRRAIYAFLWLFMGFIIAFAVWHVILTNNMFNFQIQTYCQINSPANFQECVNNYSGTNAVGTTGFVTAKDRLLMIFTNNIYVLLFTLVFSLLFGAGAIFVLAWNASVIAAAIGIFTKTSLASIPIGLARYMIHGIPEIASYFIVALAGGIISVAIIKHEYGTEKFWEVMQDALNLVVAAIIILFIAALIEVYVTPALFPIA